MTGIGAVGTALKLDSAQRSDIVEGVDMQQGVSPNPKLVGGQNRYELDEFIIILNYLKPVTYLEIGTREGHALKYMLDRVPSIREVTIVDLVGGRWGKANSDRVCMENLRSCDLDRCNFILGNSKDEAVIEEVYVAAPYDVVFIDGDHTIEGVRHDYETYGPLAEQAVALHDVCARDASRAVGCKHFWIELEKSPYKRRIIVEPGSHRGIGVLFT